MKLCIKNNYVALSNLNLPMVEQQETAHMIFLGNFCNFKCCFCEFKDLALNDAIFKRYSIESLVAKIKDMLKLGNVFKITGGEPLLNSDLEVIMNLIKHENGMIYLNTNGSVFAKLKRLIDFSYIDFLSLTLTGVNKHSALNNSGINNEDIVWNNFFLV